MNGTFCVISPEMKWTSRDRRSSLATMTARLVEPRVLDGGLEPRAALQRISALAGLDLLKVATSVMPSRSQKRTMAAR